MKRLFTYGYAKGSLRDLRTFAAQGAIIADVRFVPYAKDRQWNKAVLQRVLGENYRHLGAFGNRNYKVGGVFDLVDEERGFQQLRNLLERQPVVLLCGCSDYTVCHRTAIAVVAGQRWPELDWFSMVPGFDLNGEWIEDQM